MTFPSTILGRNQDSVWGKSPFKFSLEKGFWKRIQKFGFLPGGGGESDFWRKLLIYSPSARVKYLISSPSNLNFGVIPPWLEKIFNLAPLKCLEMLPNRPDMWKLTD